MSIWSFRIKQLESAHALANKMVEVLASGPIGCYSCVAVDACFLGANAHTEARKRYERLVDSLVENGECSECVEFRGLGTVKCLECPVVADLEEAPA